MSKVLIEIEGGCVIRVISDVPDIKVDIIDYDVLKERSEDENAAEKIEKEIENLIENGNFVEVDV